MDGESRTPPFLFACAVCTIREKAHFRLPDSKLPRAFAKCVDVADTNAVLTFDPFASREKGQAKLLLLGGACSVDTCRVDVCVECSIFFGKRFCLECAKSLLKEFPVEVQQRVQRRLEKRQQ